MFFFVSVFFFCCVCPLPPAKHTHTHPCTTPVTHPCHPPRPLQRHHTHSHMIQHAPPPTAQVWDAVLVKGEAGSQLIHDGLGRRAARLHLLQQGKQGVHAGGVSFIVRHDAGHDGGLALVAVQVGGRLRGSIGGQPGWILLCDFPHRGRHHIFGQHGVQQAGGQAGQGGVAGVGSVVSVTVACSFCGRGREGRQRRLQPRHQGIRGVVCVAAAATA